MSLNTFPVKVSGVMQKGMTTYVDYAKGYLEDAYANYSKLGFKMPSETKDVLIGDWKTSEWSPKSGCIYLIYNADLGELAFDCAHEFFHMVQYEYLGFSVMKSNSWWTEATADYAAGRVVWGRSSLAAPYMGEKIKSNYLEESIEFVSEDETNPYCRHHYHTSYFIESLVSRQGQSSGKDIPIIFKDMWEKVAKNLKDGATKGIAGWLGSEDRLKHEYQNFAQYFLFNVNSPLPASPKEKVPADAAAGNWAILKVKDKVVTSNSMDLKARYSARLWGVVVDVPADQKSRKVSIETAKDLPENVAVYVYLLSNDKRSDYVDWNGPLPTNSLDRTTKRVDLDVTKGTGLYVLAVNYGDADQKVALKVGEPSLEIQKPLAKGEKGVTEQDYSFTIIKNFIPDDAKYEWSFGDKGTAQGESAVHAFANEGKYTVKATATWKGGSAENNTGMDIENGLDFSGKWNTWVINPFSTDGSKLGPSVDYDLIQTKGSVALTSPGWRSRDIVGTISGNSFTGTFKNSDPLTKGLPGEKKQPYGQTYGTVEMTFSSDGNHFTGRMMDELWGSDMKWVGERIP